MRIAVGSFQHETNTFSTVRTAADDFFYCEGREALKKIAVTGYLKAAGADIVPTIYANALPSGVVEARAFRRFAGALVDALPPAADIDGVWLYLHGAMEVEGLGSGEVALLEAVRAKIGYGTPVSLALDFHANNSERLGGLANVICGYRTAPHTDREETQLRAARLLVECIRNRMLPRPTILRIPMMLSGEMTITGAEPMKSVISEAKRAEEQGGFLSVSVFSGQPWADTVNTGACVVVVPRREGEAAQAAANTVAKALALKLWAGRRDYRFQVEALDPDEAVEKAMKETEGITFLTDSGDNVTAGAPGDNALLLKKLIEAGARSTLVAGIADSRFLRLCSGLRKGSAVESELGGGLDPQHSERIGIEGTVLSTGEVLGRNGGCGGKAAVVSVSGLDVVVTERRSAFTSPQIFRSLGIDLEAYKLVVVKLGYLYPGLEPMAHKAIMALTPGATDQRIRSLPFCRVNRPVYPLDEEFDWQA